MHTWNRFLLYMMTINLWLSCFSYDSVLAAGEIPRNDLRLELILATGAVDTSWLSRIVTHTGLTPTYSVDSVYGISHAKFAWSGGLQSITGWSWSQVDDFTLSFWVRVRSSELPTSTGMTLPSTWLPSYWTIAWTSTQYLSTFFSSQVSPGVNSLNVRLRSDYMCAIWWKNQSTGLLYLDAINNPSFLVNCSKLNDSKWHVMVLRRYNKVLSIRIDSTDIYSSTSDMVVWRTVWIGNFLSLANTWALAYSMWQDYRITNSNSFYKWSMAGVRLYSRYLTDLEVNAISEEFLYAQSSLSGVWNISLSLEGYIRPTIKLLLSAIPLNLSKNLVTYQYSVNGTTFYNIDSTTITDASTGTWSFIYRFWIDMSSVPDGNITLTLRVKNGTSFQNVGTVNFNKSDQVYAININQPDTYLGTSKSISATVGGSGALSLSLTRGNICDATLVFEAYSDLVFTSKADNSVRVCYKAYYSWVNKTIFKLSEPIQGINSTSNTTLTSKVFDDYVYWTRSLYPRFNDSASLVLDLLSVSGTGANGTINGVTMTDINGDGLVDFLFSRSDPVRRAIIVNSGNYSFKIAYKCAIDGTAYYGDCADLYR